MNESQPRSRHAALIAVAVVVLIAAFGIVSRIHAHAQLRERTEAAAIISVQVVKIASAPATEELALPAGVEAWADAPLYARTSGYLKRWLVDIGAPVKAGQLLAEIDAPEVDQQMSQAQAELTQAQANEALSRSTAKRWQDLLPSGAVSKQAAEEKTGDLRAKQAATAAARANLQRLRDTQGFQRIVAPFDGVVTARNVDTGQLVGGTPATELFRVADTHRLRVYVEVPQAYAAATRPGGSAQVRVAGHAGMQYPAKIIGTSESIDIATRTLRVQLEMDNPNGALLPGAYAEAAFKLDTPAQTVRLPANAALFGAKGLQAAVVDGSGQVRMTPLVVGRDFGTELEVLSGLAAGERVVVNPPDSLADGETVHVVEPAPAKPEGK